MTMNLLVTMSGGTTSVINATLVGIVKAANKSKQINRIYAGCPGITGALQESMIDLTDMSNEELALLYYTPASSFIGTTRIKPVDSEQLERLAEVFDAHDIGYFVNIGGNGTIKQSIKISEYFSGSINIASVAKTVDNDLGDKAFEKVLYTPGFPSCANYWRHKIWIMNQENLGAYEHDKVLITQTFGRKTGFLAGCARLGDTDRNMPLVLLLPEDQRPLDEVLTHIDFVVSKYGRAIVVMSEGYDVGDIGEEYDLSGQIMYGTSKTAAAQLLVNHCTEHRIQARAFVPGFDQRSEINFVSPLDLERAMCVGQKSVEWLVQGDSDFLASISADPFDCDAIRYSKIPFAQINDWSRDMPDKWFLKGGFDVTDSYISYVRPLLDNEPAVLPRRDGELLFARTINPNVDKKLKSFDEKLLSGGKV